MLSNSFVRKIQDYSQKKYQCESKIYLCFVGLTDNCGQSATGIIDITNDESIEKSIDATYKNVCNNTIEDQLAKKFMEWWVSNHKKE